MAAVERKLWVTSMYGYNGREPLVTVTMPGGEFVQFSPEDARAFALNVLEAAEASEQDGFIVEWVQEVIGAGEQQAAGLLGEFRKWREKRGK